MRSLSLLLLLAAAVYAQEQITDNGYAIPEYDPLPSDGEPEETPENTDWAPEDREMDDTDVVEINDVDGGRAEDAFHHHGHHGHHGHFHHGGYRNGHFGLIHGHGRFPFYHGRRYGHHHGHLGFRPKVVVIDKHHVVAHPKKPCNKIVKHVTVHTHARPHHHHHDSSSSSEEVPSCGCRAHRHGGHHHHHHGHGFGHHYGHHGHHFGHHGHHHGHGINPVALAPFM